jgi:lipase ATG15
MNQSLFFLALGGGIAMITGAQTEIPSIGVSGPNAMLSRKTFDPPVSVDALNKFTFNIVPDLDPVPRFDDIAQNYQRIECRASKSRFFDCHMVQRTLCEILYTCGSEGRPIPCACVNKYDYDLPTSINGKNFSDYCTDK